MSRIDLRTFNFKPKFGSQSKLPIGFTILELMISSAVFAVVLLIVAIGIISFTNSYYQGINSSNVQSVARSIMAEVSQSLEFNQGFNNLTTQPSSAVVGYCIGNTMYSYELGQEVVNPPSSSDQGDHGLVVNTNSSCTSSSSPSISDPLPQSSEELLNQHMRLGVFNITPLPGNLYSVHIRVIYGDNNVLKPNSLPNLGADWSTVGCASGPGSQFCAVSDLTTTVQERII